MNLPPEVITFLTAMIPFSDMKLAIPLGTKMGLSITSSFLFSVSGSIVLGAISLILLNTMTESLRKKFPSIDKLCDKVFKKTRKEHSKRFKRYGTLLIMMFIAIPLPGSGTVSGSLIAFVFGVDYWKALTLIISGAIIAGILITAGVGSIGALLTLFT